MSFGFKIIFQNKQDLQKPRRMGCYRITDNRV